MKKNDVKWKRVDERYMQLVHAMLDRVEREMDRLYWNKYQQKFIGSSPFVNSGALVIKTDTFVLRSYDWDGNSEPNFETDQLQVFWYKHSNRGVEAYVHEDNTCIAETVCDVLNESLRSAKRYYGEEED